MAAKLTKSQRVLLMESVAEHLENKDYTVIDMILKQFSFPITDEWPGSKKSYILEMIGSPKDEDLLELAEHFGIEAGGMPDAQVKPDPPFWEEGRIRTFISHLSSQKTQAAKLKESLLEYGLTGFVAHNDIQPTAEWQAEIETALETCELLIALVHPKFIESQWCDQEIGYALGRGVPVFTVRCGADPYGFVSRFQAFNGNGKSEEEVAHELFRAASVHKKLQDRMATVLVDMFVNSGSYAAAKSRIGYLESIKVWDSGFSARLTKACAENSQIRDSWGVPSRVKVLIDKWK